MSKMARQPLVQAVGEPIYSRRARTDHELSAIINRRRRDMRLPEIHARAGIIQERSPRLGYYRYKAIVSDVLRSDLRIIIIDERIAKLEKVISHG